MNRLRVALILGSLLCSLGTLTCVRAVAQEKGDPGIGILAGEWKIEYTHGAVRVYVIDKIGSVAGTAEEEKLKGQISRKDGVLLLIMEGDGKLERLTLGVDGRLFVEHYNNKDDYPEKKATHIGIGARQR
ncbi:MAG TPA: hypothetical protein VKE98_18350 [Gemmataceae bacterium]|nr:hypothetical protein [Gemmataceae bacterium]